MKFVLCEQLLKEALQRRQPGRSTPRRRDRGRKRKGQRYRRLQVMKEQLEVAEEKREKLDLMTRSSSMMSPQLLQ